MRVIVVGAGILGAAIAWSLARSGATVTVIDERPAPGQGATAASFSWINACNGNRPPYFDLRMHALRLWRDWRERFADAGIRFGGGLSWELEGEALAAHVREHSSWGYDIRIVEADEIRILEPTLAKPPARAALAALEGAVESPRFAGMLLADSGADILTDTRVEEILFRSGRACGVRTASGSLDADAVVIASGTGTPRLLAACGFALPMRHAPGLTAVARPGAVSLSRILVTPDMEIRQRDDGMLLYTLHIPGQAGDAFDGVKAVERATEALRELLGEPGIEVAQRIPAFRPIPEDGFPAVGPVPGVERLFMAVTHSGVTLAPALGEMLSREVLGGEPDPLLRSYRPSRFAGEAAARP